MFGAVAGRASHLQGKHVLVVEDEPDALELIVAILRRAGAHVIPADSPRVALQCARDTRLDLVVSDIGLPEMDGYELAAELRKAALAQGSHPRMVAFTAFTRPSDRQRSQEAGFDAHIAKPVDAVALVELVRRLLALA